METQINEYSNIWHTAWPFGKDAQVDGNIDYSNVVNKRPSHSHTGALNNMRIGAIRLGGRGGASRGLELERQRQDSHPLITPSHP